MSMGRYRKPRHGEPVAVKGMQVPFTFWPDSHVRNGRIATLDPWRCLQVHVHSNVKDQKQKQKALAFLEQAEDFYHAAEAPRIASKPLLHYYSFLNLAKSYLAVKKGLDLSYSTHGLREPSTNRRKRMTITSQMVEVDKIRNKSYVSIYHKLVRECGFTVPAKPKPMKVVDLLEQAVNINGITAWSMGRPCQFFPLADIRFEYDSSTKDVWISWDIRKNNLMASANSASNLRKNMTAFEEVTSSCKDFRRFESIHARRYTRSPIQVLRKLVNDTWHDIWSELKPGGYQFWVSSIPKAKRLAQLAAAYQAMFYFGSLTRYRPDDFHKLADGKHGWMVQEFLNTQPLQFVYFLGSGMIDSELVMPELTAK